jgi:DNA modification methylase
MIPTCNILTGDCIEVLRTLPDESVHCCITSPPYWGLRDYGCAGQIGLEKTPDEYVAKMVAVFREVRRVLRRDGTCWVNLGDSYNNSDKWGGGQNSGKHTVAENGDIPSHAVGNRRPNPPGLKPKDLCGIPWRVAFALQADGWYLRQDVIWHKPNPMPESVTDRCTKAHEYIFLLSKSARYFYDAEAVKDQSMYPDDDRKAISSIDQKRMPTDEVAGVRLGSATYPTRNKRSVWTVPSAPYSEAHFATFPPDLIRPCVLAGTSERGCCGKCGAALVREVKTKPMVIARSNRTHDFGRTRSSGALVSPAENLTTGWHPACQCAADPVPCTILDPFGGSGTTGMVALEYGRSAILIELNPEYVKLANRRTLVTPSML